MGDVLIDIPLDHVPPTSHSRPTSPSTPSSPRLYAPIPKRRRGNDSSSGGSETGDEATPLPPLSSPPHKALKFTLGPRVDGGSDREGPTGVPGIVVQREGAEEGREAQENDSVEDLAHTDDLDDSSASTLKTPSDSGLFAHAKSTAEEHNCARDGCWHYSNNSASFTVDDSDRLSDDYASRGGGKKRKVPASAQQGPSPGSQKDETSGANVHHNCKHDGEGEGEGQGKEGGVHHHSEGCGHPEHATGKGGDGQPHRRMTPARKAAAFEKRLFQARKSQVLSLLSDASACIKTQNKSTAKLPTKEELEGMLTTLEYAGVTAWEGDQVGLGAGIWEGHAPKIKGDLTVEKVHTSLEKQPGDLKWKRRGRALERWKWMHRPQVKRGGWIPEGSFEFEMRSPVSSALSKINTQLSFLRSQVTHLLTLTLNTASSMKAGANAPPTTPAPLAHKDSSTKHTTPSPRTATPATASAKPVPSKNDKHHQPLASKSPNAAQSKVSHVPAKPGEPLKPQQKVPSASDIKVEATVDDPDFVPSTSGKKKPKKKKRSAIANAANPHHVKNYVPSRRPTAVVPEPPTLPDLINFLFFPPPTRFLNARPPRSRAAIVSSTDAQTSGSGATDTTSEGGGPPPPNDGGEDEYVCCFCEYDLFFGSDHLMDKGVRRRKKVLERRNKAEEKAKGVMDGKGLGLKSTKKKEEKVESGCEGGDNCRCAEIRANRKAKKGGKKNEISTSATAHPPVTHDATGRPKTGTKFEATVVGMADGSPLPPGATPIGTKFTAELMGEVPEGKSFEEFAKECLLPEVDSFDIEPESGTASTGQTARSSISEQKATLEALD